MAGGRAGRTGRAAALVRACRRAGVRDDRILDAVAAVDRADFVPPDQRTAAAEDRPIAIGSGQTTSQPSLIALMLQHMAIDPGDVVLEVGTGSGYQTALLARLAARVVSVERHARLARRAAARLAHLDHVDVHVGDGTLGWPDAAPYDAITVGAVGPRIPDALVAQLADGARAVMPLARDGREQVVVCRRDGDRVVVREIALPVRFVPLVGAQGYGEEGPDGGGDRDGAAG